MVEKKKYEPPSEFKIKYVIKGWSSASERFFQASAKEEALKDLYHSLEGPHSHAGNSDIEILSVSKYNRFTDKWEEQENE